MNELNSAVKELIMLAETTLSTGGPVKAEKAARSAYKEAYAAYERDKSDTDAKHNLANSSRLCGLYKCINGKPEEALPYSKFAFSCFNEIYSSNSHSFEALFNVSLATELLGDNYSDLDQNGEAEAMYSLALQMRQEVLHKENTQKNQSAVENLAGKRKEAAGRSKTVDYEEVEDFFDFSYETGDEEFESGRFRDAAESYANAVRAGLILAEGQGGVLNARNAGMACKKAGDTQVKLRRFKEAVEYYARMEDLFHQALSQSKDRKDLYVANLAQAAAGAAYAAWGRTGDARKKYEDALHSAEALCAMDPAQFQDMLGEYKRILNSL